MTTANGRDLADAADVMREPGETGRAASAPEAGAAATARPQGPPAKTVIIGARGRMGAMLHARAGAAGLCAAGVDAPLTPEVLAPACAGADMALLCVPAAVFGAVPSPT